MTYTCFKLNRKEGGKMPEEKIINKIKEALPNMTTYEQGYFLGYAEATASQAEQRREAAKHDEPVLQ